MLSRVLRAIVLSVILMSAWAVAENQNAAPTHYNEATVAQLQAEMASGKLNSEQLTQYYLNRILALDQNGPGVNSVIEINPDALANARQMDALRRRGTVLGPLHGIPVLLKDNIDTGDKMQTTRGIFRTGWATGCAGFHGGGEPAQRRSRDSRQDQPFGVGELPLV